MNMRCLCKKFDFTQTEVLQGCKIHMQCYKSEFPDLDWLRTFLAGQITRNIFPNMKLFKK